MGRAGEQNLQGPVMLLGQELGRSHQSRLVSALEHPGRRQCRDDGLPGANLALQQTSHRIGVLQIVLNLMNDSSLCSSELEREVEKVGHVPPSSTGGRLLLPPHRPQAGDRSGQTEQLVESEAAVSRSRHCLEALQP